MTKYVVPVPDPAPGADWSTVVPGIYLWDVVGITAQLTTGTAGNLLADASGNGNDGTFTSPTPFGAFVPGLLAGLDAWQPNAAPGTPHFDAANLPNVVDAFTAPFTVAWWQRYDASEIGGGSALFVTASNTLATGFQIAGVAVPDGAGGGALQVNVPGGGWASPDHVLIADGAMHFVELVYDGGTGFDLRVDSALVPWAVAVPVFPTDPVDFTQLGNPDIGAGTYQALGFFSTALSGGDSAALYAAGAGGIGAYVAAALTFGPTALYLLDGVSGGTGREPTLLVSDGTHNVLAIPTGFGAVTSPGPYGYAWQPGLNADTQSADGALTTVAIPALVIPAGYTIGTQTLDLTPTDQWSEISVWWDDSVQQLAANLGPYDYGNGAHLIYHQLGT